MRSERFVSRTEWLLSRTAQMLAASPSIARAPRLSRPVVDAARLMHGHRLGTRPAVGRHADGLPLFRRARRGRDDRREKGDRPAAPIAPADHRDSTKSAVAPETGRQSRPPTHTADVPSGGTGGGPAAAAARSASLADLGATHPRRRTPVTNFFVWEEMSTRLQPAAPPSSDPFSGSRAGNEVPSDMPEDRAKILRSQHRPPASRLHSLVTAIRREASGRASAEVEKETVSAPHIPRPIASLTAGKAPADDQGTSGLAGRIDQEGIAGSGRQPGALRPKPLPRSPAPDLRELMALALHRAPGPQPADPEGSLAFERRPDDEVGDVHPAPRAILAEPPGAKAWLARPGPAPAAPLDDPARLAEQIERLLRDEARRHGIDV